MTNVLLLRAPSRPDDRYETAFTAAGYNAISVPVLETVFTNTESLKAIIERGPAAKNFDGVIVTSARAGEVWKTVVGELVRSSASRTTSDNSSWSSTPFYVVGQATASALAEISQNYGHTDYAPTIIRGESTGTGERLAQFIRDQVDEKPQKLLYLTGDKNRETLPTILREAGIELVPLGVYETRGSHTFEQDLAQALEEASNPASNEWWIVHFAPSAAEFVTPILRKHLKPENLTLKVGAIGSMTASYLLDELKIHVDVVSPKPAPQDLVAAIAKSGL